MKRSPCATTIALLAVFGAQALTTDPKREQMIAATLPAGDRAGIFLIFPIEAGGFALVFDIVYFPDEVSE